jgi:predicted MPP superfamily phosphohydrolase
MPIFRFLIFFLVFILLNIYLYIRGWQALPDRYGIHFIYAILYIVASTSVFIGIFLGSRLPLWLSHTLELIGGYWIILFLFILAAAFIGDILRIADRYLGIFPHWVTSNYQQAKLGYFLAVMGILLMISVFGYIRFSNTTVTRIRVPVENSDHSTGEVHMVAVSDVHLGNLIRKGRLGKWVNIINNENPDIIVIAGDLFDHNMRTVELQQMNQELSRLRAPLGVFAIPGNHDYYAGIDQAISFMEKSGIKVLRDQTVTVGQKFALIGRDDITNRNRKTLKSLISDIRPGIPRIVLDHQPHSFAESREHNIDLHISGHTHNGQIFPFNLIVAKIYELGYGYMKTGNTHYYVSSGLGLWGAPIRIGTHSEIVSIVLMVN